MDTSQWLMWSRHSRTIPRNIGRSSFFLTWTIHTNNSSTQLRSAFQQREKQQTLPDCSYIPGNSVLFWWKGQQHRGHKTGSTHNPCKAREETSPITIMMIIIIIPGQHLRGLSSTTKPWVRSSLRSSKWNQSALGDCHLVGSAAN